MEGDADSDLSTIKLDSSLSDLGSADLPSSMSFDSLPVTLSDCPLSSLDDSEDAFLVSSQDTLLCSSSSEFTLGQSEHHSLSLSTLESSVAHPLGSLTNSLNTSVVSEVSAVPVQGLVDYDSDSSFQDDVCHDAETEVDISSKMTGKGFFQTTKFDILKAMKAEVGKSSGGKTKGADKSEVSSVPKNSGNGTTAEDITESAGVKVSNCTEAKVKTNVSEDAESKVMEDNGVAVTDGTLTKDSKDNESRSDEDIKTKVDENTKTKDDKEFVYIETKKSGDIEIKVSEDAETNVKEHTGVKGYGLMVKRAVDIGAKVTSETTNKAQEGKETRIRETIETKVDINVSEDPEVLVHKTLANEGTGAEGKAETESNEVTEAEVTEASVGNPECPTMEINNQIEAKISTAVNGVKEADGAVLTQTDGLNTVKGCIKETVDVGGGNADTSPQEKLVVECGEAVETNVNKMDELAKDTETEDMQVSEQVEAKGCDSTENFSSTIVKANKGSEPGTSGNRKVEDTKPGTSWTPARGNKRSLDKDEQIVFECNGDSHNETDSILQEEALRLDELNLPSQVTPEPIIEGGELEREVQYRKLVDLLSKSKFYTDVLLKKVEADVIKFCRKRKYPDSASNGSFNDETQGDSLSKQGSPSKRKKILMENQRALYHIASEVVKAQEQSEKVDKSSSESQSTVGGKPVEEIKQPKYLCGGTLRDYQLEGFQWLKVLYENGVNGILADEMGLGKTIQVIALLSHLVEMKVKGPFLIVGPLSTLPNWVIEFKRFAPQLHVVLFYGSKTERKKMTGTLMKRKAVNGVLCFPIVVTSYEVPVFERAFMARQKWKYIIVDEGHKIKNYNTLLAKVLRTFESANRLLLTGTPLQNSLSELWSLLNFLVPEIFDNLDVFESWFRLEELSDDAGRKKIIEEERRKNVLSTLHQILAPFMLRRVKTEVTLDIPKKKEVLVKAPMTEMQLKLYQALLEKNFVVLKKLKVDDLIIPDVDGKRPRRSCTLGKSTEEKSDTDDSENSFNRSQKNDIDAIITHYIRVKMQNPWVALKQVANHPYMIHYPLQEDGVSLLVDEGVVKSSGKFLVLDAMLKKLHAKGHKVLIFSTLCMLLDVVEDYLSWRNYYYERLDGNVKIGDRAESIQRFNSDPEVFIFLLSTRAGGLGVNLTGADTVIFLDSDWNPQADLQAQDRCHRIGQTKPVMVYRLVTTGTIEEQILQRASAKRVLEKMVICKGASTQKGFDLDELKTILESRDHSDIVYTDGQVLTDEQLEKLLDRSDLLD